jgi:hypothetical protein
VCVWCVCVCVCVCVRVCVCVCVCVYARLSELVELLLNSALIERLPERRVLLPQACQYLYFCTSKASKLSTCRAFAAASSS